jgi:hypothetical protein
MDLTDDDIAAIRGSIARGHYHLDIGPPPDHWAELDATKEDDDTWTIRFRLKEKRWENRDIPQEMVETHLCGLLARVLKNATLPN